MGKFLIFLSLYALLFFVESECKPNIVVIVSDDLGSYDASIRGSNQIVTPNLDALAYHGIFLNSFYTAHICTPSRSSIMTGKYPHKMGMHHTSIPGFEPWGLGLNEKLMSNYFHDAGYKTHLVGKWHLGYYQKKYTPLYRGFDSHTGYYNGWIDYYNYTYDTGKYVGKDFREGENLYGDTGKYATDLFKDEAVDIIKKHDRKDAPLFLMINHLAPHVGNTIMQAPQDVVDTFSYIADENRRKLAAMITKLDKSVGTVVEALKNNNLMENTIIFFCVDNGAAALGNQANYGSNFPLRGQRGSPWEGAIRNIAMIYSPLIKENQRVYDGYFHTSDILPTLASAAGITIDGNVDGLDHWDTFVNDGPTLRKRVVSVLDNYDGFSAIIQGKWKLVNGTTQKGKYDGYLGEIQEFSLNQNSYTDAVLGSRTSMALHGVKSAGNKKLTPLKIFELRQQATISCNIANNPIIVCNPLEAPCLFDIKNDPCERKNLADIYPATLANLTAIMDEEIRMALPSRRVALDDPLSHPTMDNSFWQWWIEDSAQ